MTDRSHTSTRSFDALLEENRQLLRAVNELSLLNDLARTIGGSRSTEDVMQTIIHQSLQAVAGEQGLITLIDRDDVSSFKTLVRTMSHTQHAAGFHLHDAIVGWMCLNNVPLLINDPGSDRRFSSVDWPADVRHIICAPLSVKSELIGVLTVCNKKAAHGFTADDQRILSIIATQSAQVVENSRLFEQERTLFEMQKEMSIAARIQLDLLPKTAPMFLGYDLAGTTVPAHSVGGDYFDFIRLDEHRLGICVADVTGKGMPAALLMANVQATLRGQVLIHSSPKDGVERSNTLLYHSTNTDRFVTLFYGMLDNDQHVLRFCNAGHDPPLLFTGESEPLELRTGGIVLGILPDFTYDEHVVDVPPESLLVAYSDGITEAKNSSDQEYGSERLTAFIAKHRHQPANELAGQILDDVRGFAGKAAQSDDMTLLIVRRE